MLELHVTFRAIGDIRKPGPQLASAAYGKRPFIYQRLVGAEVVSAIHSSLRLFTQLRSLELRDVGSINMDELADALDSMPALASLELNAYNYSSQTAKLMATLHRLCSTQLDHLTVSREQLILLTVHYHDVAMPRLRSLALTPGTWTGMPDDALDRLFYYFPFLSHLTVVGYERNDSWTSDQLPQLSSCTVHLRDTCDVYLPVNTRTLCVLLPTTNLIWLSEADRFRLYSEVRIFPIVINAPQLLQLAITEDWQSTAD